MGCSCLTHSFGSGWAALVVGAVCSVYELQPAELLSSARPHHIAWPRQVAMTLVYLHGELSALETARLFGRKEHGTVLHACAVVLARTSQKEFAEKLARVRLLLNLPIDPVLN